MSTGEIAAILVLAPLTLLLFGMALYALVARGLGALTLCVNLLMLVVAGDVLWALNEAGIPPHELANALHEI